MHIWRCDILSLLSLFPLCLYTFGFTQSHKGQRFNLAIKKKAEMMQAFLWINCLISEVARHLHSAQYDHGSMIGRGRLIPYIDLSSAVLGRKFGFLCWMWNTLLSVSVLLAFPIVHPASAFLPPPLQESGRWGYHSFPPYTPVSCFVTVCWGLRNSHILLASDVHTNLCKTSWIWSLR